ncbi:MAG: hypothetical protein WC712_13020 [Candidatus Brocadiia bacterium]
MRYGALSVIVLGLLCGASWCISEEVSRDYIFNPRGQVDVVAWGSTENEKVVYDCPVLSGRNVVIPARWKWSVSLRGPQATHLAELKEHIVGRRVNVLTIGYRLTKEDLDVIGSLSWLESIRFSSVFVREDWLARLDGCGSLSRISFSSCEFEAPALERLNRSKSLAKLEISECFFADQQFAMLRGNNAVVEIACRSIPPLWTGFKVLSSLPNLEKLTLSGRFTDEDVLLLEPLAKLKYISLSSPFITAAFEKILTGMNGLCVVDVTCTGSPEKLLSACAKLPELFSIDLVGSQFDEVSLSLLGSLGRLEWLGIGRCSGVDLRTLKNCRKLKWLGIDAGVLRKADVESAGKMEALSSLDVSGEVGEQEARFIAALPGLKHLSLQDRLTKEGAEVLSTERPKLEHLLLSGEFDDDQMKCVSALNALSDLDIAHAVGLSKAGLALFAKLTKLRHLRIWDAQEGVIDDLFLEVLSKLTELEDVALSPAELLTSEGVGKLSSLQKLTQFAPSFARLREMHESLVSMMGGELAYHLIEQHKDLPNTFPGSGQFPPTKWTPLGKNSYYGYQFTYFSDASSPEVADGAQFAFLAIPTSLDNGRFAFLDGSLAVGGGGLESISLDCEDIEQLRATVDKDVLRGDGTVSGFFYLKGVPFLPRIRHFKHWRPIQVP